MATTNFSILSFILASLSIITFLLFLFVKNKIVYSKSKAIKYFPIGLAIVSCAFVAVGTIYSNYIRDKKIEDFNKLKIETNNLDTSYNKIEKLSQPNDIYSKKRIDSLYLILKKSDSLNKKLSSVKNYLLAENIFSKVKPDVKDSVKVTFDKINNIQQSLKKTSNNLNKNDLLNHGYVYAGNIINGKWIQNNFKNLTHSNDTLPCVNDILLIVQPIFVRAGETHNVDGKGWVNQQLLGTLEPKRKITIKEIIPLSHNFYWIRF